MDCPICGKPDGEGCSSGVRIAMCCQCTPKDRRIAELQAACMKTKQEVLEETLPSLLERVRTAEHALKVCRADASRNQGTSHSEMARALKTIIMTVDNVIGEGQ